MTGPRISCLKLNSWIQEPSINHDAFSSKFITGINKKKDQRTIRWTGIRRQMTAVVMDIIESIYIKISCSARIIYSVHKFEELKQRHQGTALTTAPAETQQCSENPLTSAMWILRLLASMKMGFSLKDTHGTMPSDAASWDEYCPENFVR